MDSGEKLGFPVLFVPIWWVYLLRLAIFLQTIGGLALACPADVETNNVALGYALQLCGAKGVLWLNVREILTLSPLFTLMRLKLFTYL